MRTLAFFLLAAALAAQTPPLFIPRLDDPRLHYYDAAHDAVSELQKRLDSGATQLEYSEKWGYLESVLKELKIPVSSQTLVFTKTSLQVNKISPDHPRAIYFNDEVYVGMVRGGLLEFVAADPQKGAVFYVLEQKKASAPKLIRKDQECLSCHFTVNTMRIPGFLTRSVFPASSGEPILEAGSWLTDHRSPLAQRWGGWYVTGTHGSTRHLGNSIAGGNHKIDSERGANLTDLKKFFNTALYPVPSSDLVALMVLNHQVQFHNLVTRLAYEAALGRAEINATVESMLRYLLFIDEARLSEPTAGTSPFRAEFEKLGPADPQGRSLRQFDLSRRLFKYPCSFLIYSDSFEALPKEAKDPLYRRLWEVLSGRDQTPAYNTLSMADRKAILEILIATKPSLPPYFRSGN